MVNLLKETSFNNFVYKKYEGSTVEEQKKRYEPLDQGKDEKEIEKRAPVDVPIYFYHPDHLGTTNALTDVNGNMYQFFLNLPLGETMAEQTSISTSRAFATRSLKSSIYNAQLFNEKVFKKKTRYGFS